MPSFQRYASLPTSRRWENNSKTKEMHHPAAAASSSLWKGNKTWQPQHGRVVWAFTLDSFDRCNCQKTAPPACQDGCSALYKGVTYPPPPFSPATIPQSRKKRIGLCRVWLTSSNGGVSRLHLTPGARAKLETKYLVRNEDSRNMGKDGKQRDRGGGGGGGSERESNIN